MRVTTSKLALLSLVLFLLTGFLADYFLGKVDTDINPTEAIVAVTSYRSDGNLTGSGFLLDDGYVITTSHGIGDPTSDIYVTVPELGEYSVELLTFDEAMDVAVLKITSNSEDLPYLKLGNSDELILGQEVRTMEGVGVITDLDSSISAAKSLLVRDFSNILQFNAKVSSGASGGPLLDNEDKVIGMIVVHTPGKDSLNFAVPGNQIRALLKELIEF